MTPPASNEQWIGDTNCSLSALPFLPSSRGPADLSFPNSSALPLLKGALWRADVAAPPYAHQTCTFLRLSSLVHKSMAIEATPCFCSCCSESHRHCPEGGRSRQGDWAAAAAVLALRSQISETSTDSHSHSQSTKTQGKHDTELFSFVARVKEVSSLPGARTPVDSLEWGDK